MVITVIESDEQQESEHPMQEKQSLSSRQPEEHSSLRLSQDSWGFFGAELDNISNEPILLWCDELLELAAFVEQHRAWIEEHAKDNKALIENEERGSVYIWLQSKSDPTKRDVLLLITENSLAWYGTPVSEARDAHMAGTVYRKRQAYLRTEWEECANRSRLLFDVNA